MKKTLATISSTLAILLILAACGSTVAQTATEPPETPIQQTSQVQNPPVQPQATDSPSPSPTSSPAAESAGAGAAELAELEITFNFARQSGWASNQFAVWIEDADGTYIKTLYATRWTAVGGFRTRPMSIPTWVEQSNLPQKQPAEVDLITSPTPQSGILTYIWDLTDSHGNAITEGEYKFFIESSFRWGNRAIFSGTVNIGDIGEQNAVSAVETTFIFEESGGQPALNENAPETSMITDVVVQFLN